MTRTERVLALLERHHGVWLPATAFEEPGGRQAWRSRISDARAILRARGGDIENRLRRQRTASGGTYTLSEYRLVPAKGQADLFQESA
jgi:hypothetical protein